MFYLKHFIWLSMIYATLLDLVQGSNGPFTLRKTPQYPVNRTTDQFVIEINDRMLVDVQKVNNAYKYFVFKGEMFQNLVNSYQWDQGTINDITFSDDSIYEIVEGKEIRSRPFLNQTNLNIPNATSMLSLNQEVKLFSVYNGTSGCQYLVAIEEYEDETKKFVFDRNETNCIKANNVKLVDLGNNLIAHQKYDTVDIWNKADLSKKVDSINISGSYRWEIKYFQTFSNPLTGYSMFTISTRYNNENYTKYEYDQSEKKYKPKSRFYYQGQCHYYNQTTCVQVKDGYVILNQNIDNQLISQKIEDQTLSNLTNTKLLSITHSSKYMIGNNKTGLNIFNAGSDFVDSKNYIPNLPCVTEAKFTYDDSSILIQTQNCDNITTNNVCLVDPSGKSSPKCARKIDEKIDANYSGFVEIRNSNDPLIQNVNKICVAKYVFNANSYTIQCRSPVDLSSTNVQKSVTLVNETHHLIGLKMMHTFQMKENFWVLGSVVKSDNSTENFTHKFRLTHIGDQKNFHLQGPLQVLPFTVSFQLSGVHKEHIVSFHEKKDDKNLCGLFFINAEGVQVQKQLTYPCLDFQKSYKLVLQEGFDQVCLQIIDKGLIDCYKYDELNRLKRRSISVPQFIPNMKYFKPIINPEKNWIFFYESSSTLPSYVILNITVIPQLRVRLSYFAQTYNYPNQYAYRSPFMIDNQSKDEILSFTHYQTLYKVRNPVKKMKEIEETMHPANYTLQLENFTLEHPNPGILKYAQKTFLASTGYHLIVALFTDTNHTSLCYLELQQLFDKQRAFRPIWNYTDLTIINLVDLGWNTFSISANDDSIQFKSFELLKQIDDKEFAFNSKFQKVQVTHDDRLIFTMHKPQQNGSALYFIPSILKKESYRVKLKYENLITDLLISPSEDAFLVGTQNHIEFIRYNNPNDSAVMIKPEGFIDMYLTDTGKGAATRQKEKLSKQRLSKTKKLSPSAMRFLSQFSTVLPLNINEPNDFQLPTVIIRTTNYTMFCSTSFKNEECSKSEHITGDTIFATNKEGNYIAYVWVDSDKKEWVNVIKVSSYGKIDSVQNISLRQLDVLNNSTMKYTPTILQLFISANNTLHVLTQSIDHPTQFKLVFYVYSMVPCGENKKNINSECICEPYYRTDNIHKNGSRVVQTTECSCKYFTNSTGNCVCPIWNGFQADQYNCQCPVELEWKWNLEKGQFCDEKGFPAWIIVIIVIAGLSIPIAIYICHKYKCCCFRPDKPDKPDKHSRLIEEEDRKKKNKKSKLPEQSGDFTQSLITIKSDNKPKTKQIKGMRTGIKANIQS